MTPKGVSDYLPVLTLYSEILTEGQRLFKYSLDAMASLL